MRRFLVLLLVLGMVTGGCGGERNARGTQEGAAGKVTVMGSTALLPMAKDAAARFMAANQKVTVNVSGGGSFTGLQQVAAGAVDIGISDIEPPAGDPAYRGLVDHVVAVAPFLLITHPEVGVDNLTKEEAVGVFTGRIKNWREVGGKDIAVTIIHRPKSSGSRQVIKNIVLGGQEFTGNATVMNSNGEVRQAVANTPGAIGYIDLAYLNSTVKALKFNGVAYTKENVSDGTYPIYALEHMYTKGEPKGAVKSYIDFVLGTSYQAQIEKMGFLPASAVKG
ncbi:MAG: phosphate ABC transporter substrate-binding protein [Firmicutes bacterium]|nr:phosphate ABC transporter substrate-binding protein [Bacillota bacterium]